MADFAVAFVSGGVGFVAADALDRFLATYNPDPAQAANRPKDKFTSDGTGMLGNTLNVASRPSLVRIGAGVAATALPAVGAMFVDNELGKSSLEGMAMGAGISLFKTLWNNLLMPLLKPKDTSPGSLQKSYIARLYPTEVAAAINLDQKQTAVSSSGSGALSAPPTGVGAPADVGPFALSGDSPYPDAAQALRNAAGVHGPGNDYPTVQNTWGTGGDSPYPTAGQALRHAAGVSQPPSYEPGPPPGPGPGPQASPHKDCACLGDGEQYSSFLGEAPAADGPLMNFDS